MPTAETNGSETEAVWIVFWQENLGNGPVSGPVVVTSDERLARAIADRLPEGYVVGVPRVEVPLIGIGDEP